MATLGYIRVSTADQHHESQRHALVSAKVERWYEDTATGANVDRPALRDLLAEAKRGDTVVCYKLDRISRSVVDLLNIVERFQRDGIELVSVTEQIDTRTPMGRFALTVMAALGEIERERIRERVKAGLAARKARGLPVGTPNDQLKSRARAGRESQQAARQAAAEALRWVVEPLASEPYAQIARTLNERDIPTPAGGQWRHQSVKNLLQRLALA